MGLIQKLRNALNRGASSPESGGDDRHSLGKLGEALAASHLKRQGYTILDRNLRMGRNEIDLLAQDSDKTICFVEVKTRAKDDGIPPEAAVGPGKQAHLRHAAQIWLGQHQKADTSYRFDVVSIIMENGKAPDITLFKDAFQ